MFKKMTSAIFIAALTFGLSINAFALSSAKVNASTVNVRSGPSTKQSIVTKVYKNNTVTILETKGDWYKVKTSNGKTGWVSKSYITNMNSQKPSTPPTTVSTKTGKVNTSTLNVRRGPSAKESIVTKLYKNNTVTIIETKGDWYKIKTSDGKIGWVMGSYIVIPKTPNPSPSPKPNSSPTQNTWSEVISGTVSQNNVSSEQYFTKEGDWLYYYNYSDKCIYKIKTNGTNKTKLVQINSRNNSHITVKDGYLYYTDEGSKSAEIWKMKVDGTEKKQIAPYFAYEQWFDSLNFYKDKIYCKSSSLDIYSSKLDGSLPELLTLQPTSPRYSAIWGNKMYYTNYHENDCIYEMNLDTNEKKKINNNDSYNINLYNEYIYFINRDDNNKIYRTKIDGNTEKVSDESTLNMNIDNGWIYYQNAKDGNKLYKMKIDGTNKVKLSDDSSWHIHVVGNWIFYMKYGGKEYFMIKNDGSLKYKL